MNRLPIALFLLVVVALADSNAHGFTAPKDAAGPITVTIVAPEIVESFDSATKVRVVIENRSERPAQASVTAAVVDAWRITPPRWTVEVPARGKMENVFELSAAGTVYGALYPIHVRAECREGDHSWSLHPIHIFEAKPPARPSPQPRPEWKLFVVESGRELALWQLPVQRAVFTVFDRPAETMPVGWSGSHQGHRGTCGGGVQAVGGQSKPALSIHPPWHQGQVGTAWIEYPLQLPEGGPIKLHVFTAMNQQPEQGGDGVTFRVRAVAFDAPDGQAGEILWEEHRQQQRWTPAEIDLSRWAGKAVRLQLESHPGPKRNTAFDLSFWGEPVLITSRAGDSSAPAQGPEAGRPAIRWTAAADIAAGKEGNAAEAATKALSVEIVPGRRGLLDARVRLSRDGNTLAFDGFRVAVWGFALEDPRAPVQLLSAVPEPPGAMPNELFHPSVQAARTERGGQSSIQPPTADGPAHAHQVRHRFRTVWGEFDLLGRLWIDRGMLRAAWWLENAPPPRPWHVCRIEQAAVGPLDRTAELLYFGPGNAVRQPGEYVVGYDGHRLSTSMIGLEFTSGGALLLAVEQPPERLEVRPKSRCYTLVGSGPSLFTFVLGGDVWAAVRHWRDRNDRPAAGGVQKLAGRFVFDLWGGRYAESAEALRKAFAYGLTDACVVWHNWQRWGYDYRLPDILPPNPQLGTDDDFAQLARACREQGVLFAAHDNYIDFYPDAEGFSYVEQIAFHADGRPVKAWLNEGRGAQSFRFRADTLAPFVRRNVTQLRDRFAPTAYFIDVWASINPYDYWTAEGRFFDGAYTNRVWCEQFAWIRDTLGDRVPQISESGHDGQLGYLDGAQANHLRIGAGRGRYTWSAINWPCAEAQRVAWFDAAHHDRFVLHGAGYSERYQAGLDRRMHGIFSDDYITTEMLCGRPAMAPQPFGRDVVRKYWLTQPVARALALKKIERVEFADGTMHRQRVVWENGSVWVNRSGADWSPKPEVVLPPHGFWAELTDAHGRPITAGIVRRDGVIVEETRAAEAIYVNGRRVVEAGRRIRLSVNSVEPADGGKLRWKLVYHLDQPVPEGYRPFLHICDADGEIVTQASFDARVLAGCTGDVEVEARCRLPQEVRLPVALELRYGFYRPGDGPRLELPGRDDGTRRIRAGVVKIGPGYQHRLSVVWTGFKQAEPLSAGPRDPAPEYYADQIDQADPAEAWRQRHNTAGKPIDFGAVATADAVRITPTKNGLLVVPLPEGPAEGCALAIRPTGLPWKGPAPQRAVTIDAKGQTAGELPIRRDGDTLHVTCPAGAFGVLLSGE